MLKRQRNMAAHSQLVADHDAMLEDQIEDIWPGYPCLYDVRSPSFKNRDLREQALQKFADCLGLPVCAGFSNVFAFFAVIKETAKSLHHLTISSLVHQPCLMVIKYIVRMLILVIS